MTSDGWKLVPVEPTRKMLDEGGFYFIQGGGSVSDSDMAQAKRVYRAMLTAAPAAPQAAGWTDRHTSVTRFALWRFINDAYAQANYAAQRISREPVENVAKFQDDARTAEEARAMLAAAPAVPQAEPCIGNDPTCPCQDGDACHYKDAADGTKAWPIPQAEQRPDGWQVVPVVPTKSMNSAGLSAVNQYGKRSVWETYRAMLAAAPNVPQAEPDDDDDALVLGEPDILTPEDLRRLVPQAEPKREPLSEAQCAELSEWMWQEIGISLSNATLRRLEKKLNSIGDSDER